MHSPSNIIRSHNNTFAWAYVCTLTWRCVCKYIPGFVHILLTCVVTFNLCSLVVVWEPVWAWAFLSDTQWGKTRCSLSLSNEKTTPKRFSSLGNNRASSHQRHSKIITSSFDRWNHCWRRFVCNLLNDSENFVLFSQGSFYLLRVTDWSDLHILFQHGAG